MKKMGLFVENELLERYGENSALYLSRAGNCRGSATASAIKGYMNDIVECAGLCERRAGSVGFPEAEWLSDNRYVAERAARYACDCFRKAKGLPISRQRGVPLICAAAEAVVSAGDGMLTEKRLLLFVDGFQSIRPFTEKELSLLLPALQAALLKTLEEAAKQAINALSEPPESDAHAEAAKRLQTLFTSFRALNDMDVGKLLVGLSQVEHIFMKDPDGTYPLMDEESRAIYRRRLASLAESSEMTERAAAQKVLELAERGVGKGEHIGVYLFEKPLGADGNKRSGAGYIALIVALTAVISIAASVLLGNLRVLLLLLLPVSELVKSTVDYVAMRVVRPYQTPRMELKDGIPERAATLAVISCLPRTADEAKSLAQKVEQYSIANRDAGPELGFALLIDLPESQEQHREGDSVILDAAVESIDGLNSTYGPRFFAVTRSRSYNKGTRSWCGSERKRGAVEQLVKLLVGRENELKVIAGKSENLTHYKLLLLLDSDTRLTIASAKRLVGAMLHPAASPVVDNERGVVVSGHAMLAPAISVELNASNRSSWAAIFGGQGGLETYDTRRGDVYQDVFGRGSFAGKGILWADIYDKCVSGRFPLNTVLSHDLPEGELLRCGFTGDTELTDGFPSTAGSFWDRLHRWTRGDWQNSIWLSPAVRDAKGEKRNNPFDVLSRWKVTDNMRRSLVPVMCFISIMAAILTGTAAMTVAAAVSAVAVALPLVLGGIDSLTRLERRKGRTYRSRVTDGAGGGLLHALISLALLPQTALVTLSATLTALYRLLISKRNLLRWVTAAETEARRDTLGGLALRMRFAVAAGVVALFGAYSPLGSAVGMIWLLSPLWAWLLGRKKPEEPPVSEQNRRLLMRSAADIWRYFDSLMTPERGWLPPDNWQEEPALGAAERTSPTNIGLGVLSVLAAKELSLTTPERAMELCCHVADTLEGLDKWRGHLYNWYDLKNLTPMEPRYVSTVDSGNLAACLTAACSCLRKMGEGGVATRFERLRDEMNFSELYDNDRRLFHIGMSHSGKLEGYYDLLAGESRLTSYYAIARGIADERHWRALGRPLAYCKGRFGMASWSGSMFEYFMPELLLPAYKNSLLWESLRFCLLTQREAHKPWGMSESAYAAVDASNSYRYKAHGVQALALKRRVAEDCVVAPYATFLTLKMWPNEAVGNLRRIASLGAQGRFGLYEALDFTARRVPVNESYAGVRCYMAHHLGMSLVAMANALRSEVMTKAFMADPEMAAYSELLQEKGPIGRKVTTEGQTREERRVTVPARLWERVTKPGGGIRCAVLSNGVYSLVLTSDGKNLSKCGSIALDNFDALEAERCGISVFVSVDGAAQSLTPAPLYSPGVNYVCELTAGSAKFSAEAGFWHGEMECAVPAGANGELRRIRIYNAGASTRTFEIAFYMEPVLARPIDHSSHPAFSKLSMQTACNGEAVTVTRRPGGTMEPCALCVRPLGSFTFDTSREKALGMGGFTAITECLRREAGGTVGDVLDPCVLIRVSIRIEAGKTGETAFAVGFGGTAEEANLCASEILTGEKQRFDAWPAQTARSLAMSSDDMDVTERLLSALLYPTSRKPLDHGTRAGRRDLWRFGISGDIPAASFEVKSEKDTERAVSLIKASQYLEKMGFPCDLALICRESDGYSRPMASALRAQAEALGADRGVFFIDGATDGVEALERITADAAGGGATLQRGRQLKLDAAPDGRRSWRFEEDGSFTFETESGMGLPAWSHIMTNGRLGWLVADGGTFGLWDDNARENRLLPWINDPLADSGCEELCIIRDGHRIPLFAARDKYGCKITYGLGFAMWQRRLGPTKAVTTGYVHPERDIRVLTVALEDWRENDSLCYFIRPFPKDGARLAESVTVELHGNVLTAIDHESGQIMTTAFSTKPSLLPDGSLSFAPESFISIVVSCGEEAKEYLEKAAAERGLSETKAYWNRLCKREQISTPWPALDRYMNGWCMYQILACRIMGRSSMYQSGGAIGFRDQLQDVSVVAAELPELAKRQILEAACHQYTEGDVMHWWHRGRDGEYDRGVRTRCSDDLLWLPWAAVHYARSCGDWDIFNTTLPWVVSRTLAPGERDRYENAVMSGETSTLYEHCERAVKQVKDRGTGARGLLKIGGGDWNDGMNRVGAAGQGESVWLTFFGATVARYLSESARKLNKSSAADELERLASEWGQAADNAWDGEHYLRGTYDDGRLLGSKSSAECRLDSVAQSMAVLSGYGSPEKCAKAMDASMDALCDVEGGVIKLFDPPFDGKETPGYIRAYIPGVRENGGQYTHAAVWLAMALFDAGREEEGAKMLLSMLPSERGSEYMLEPFVLAGDVYSNPQNYGRGGWSWYTGSAGWYRTAVLEKLLPALKREVINTL